MKNFPNFIDFQKVLEPVLTATNKDNLSIIGTINNLPMKEFIPKFIQEFSSKNESNLFEKQTPNMEAFKLHFKKYLNANVCTNCVLNWPPNFPTNPTIESLIHLLLRLIQYLPNKLLFLKWVSLSCFPRIFAKNNSISSNKLKCSSVCKIDDKRYWAISDINCIFYLIQIKNEDLKLVKKGQIKAVDLNENGTSLIVTISVQRKTNKSLYEIDDSELTLHDSLEMTTEKVEFQPEYAGHLKLWTKIFNSKLAYPVFLSIGHLKYPDMYINAFYHILTSDDGYLMKAILSRDVVPKNKIDIVLENMWKVFCYASKAHLFLETLILIEFSDYNSEKQVSFIDFLSLSTNYIFKIIPIITKECGSYYFNNFALKLINYIDEKNDLFLNDPDKCDLKKAEIVFFTVLKYICSSSALVPDIIKFILHVAKLYSAASINNSEFTAKLLGYIFFNCFFKSISENYKKFDPNIIIKKQENLNHILKMLETAFSFQLFGFDFPLLSVFNSRLQYHSFLQIQTFLYGISNIDSVPIFPQQDISKVMDSLSYLADIISDNFESFKTNFRNITNIQSTELSLLNMNFQVFLISCFRWISDSDMIKAQKDAIHKERFPELYSKQNRSNSPKRAKTKKMEIEEEMKMLNNFDKEIENIDEFLEKEENSPEQNPIRESLPPAPPLNVILLS